MKLSRFVILFSFFLPIVGLAQEEAAAPAPSLKIAIVDLVRVFQHHPETDAATKDLTRKRDESRKRFSELTDQLKKTLQAHQEAIRAGKKDDAEEALKKANELERSIATIETTEARDLDQAFKKTKSKIIGDIKSAVKKFNVTAKYDLVFDSTSTSSNGLPQIIDAPSATDITDEIIVFIRESEKEE